MHAWSSACPCLQYFRFVRKISFLRLDVHLPISPLLHPISPLAPPSSSALVRQSSPGLLLRVDRFRQAYAGAFDVSPVRPSADPTAPPPPGSEDQTPAHLQRRLAGLASHIQDFAAAAAQQIASFEQSLMVSCLF